MTSPSSRPITPQEAKARKTWLLPFLEVERGADRRIDAALREAAKGLDDEIEKIAGKEGVSIAVRRSQLVGSKGLITKVLHHLFEIMGTTVREEQLKAAQAAVDASVDWDKQLLKLIEPDAAKRAILEVSLRQGAERQVQAMITRVLKTELPLSRRVWRSEALAKRQVSKLVNSGLARGISAAELAKQVRQFVDPSTSVGATYAAKRLARTEINNAFHAQSIAHNIDKPWVEGFDWHLSRSHTPRPGDKCEVYAQQGFFSKSTVPSKPHPQCFCYITPRVTDLTEFGSRAKAGEYDAWLAKQ